LPGFNTGTIMAAFHMNGRSALLTDKLKKLGQILHSTGAEVLLVDQVRLSGPVAFKFLAAVMESRTFPDVKGAKVLSILYLALMLHITFLVLGSCLWG
jgi:hypothetical protein